MLVLSIGWADTSLWSKAKPKSHASPDGIVHALLLYMYSLVIKMLSILSKSELQSLNKPGLVVKDASVFKNLSGAKQCKMQEVAAALGEWLDVPVPSAGC